MSTPSTRSAVAEFPIEKSGLAISPGTLQTRIATDPRIAAHCPDRAADPPRSGWERRVVAAVVIYLL